MPTVNILDAFTYKWGQLGTVENIDDNQWKTGWAFIGATPPSVEQFNKWGQIFDEKSNYLYSQLKTVYDLAAVVPGAADANSLRDALRAVGVFTTKAIGTNDTSAATTAFVQTALNSRNGASTVRGLTGVPNAVTPNTQYDFNCQEVQLRNPGTGATIRFAGAVTTNNIGLAGSAANGRDQAGAFANSSWVHFWFISDGVLLRTLSSASSTAPTLTAGYTYLAYIGAVYLQSGGVLQPGKFRGASFTYLTPPTILTTGGSTLRVAIPLTQWVPPNALMIRPRVTSFGIGSTAAGTYLGFVTLETDVGFTAYQFGLGGSAATNLNFFAQGGTVELPNVGQNLNYFVTATSGFGPQATIVMDGYSVPNGGE